MGLIASFVAFLLASAAVLISPWVICLWAVWFGVCLLAFYGRPAGRVLCLSLLLFTALGALRAELALAHWRAQQAVWRVPGHTGLVVGRLLAAPQQMAHRCVWRVYARWLTHGKPAAAGPIRVVWWGRAPEAQLGQMLQFWVRTRVRPMSLEKIQRLQQQGLLAELWGRQAQLAQQLTLRLPKCPLILRLWLALNQWRQRIDSWLQHQLAGRSQAAVIQALVTGERGGLSQTAWAVFRATGTSHLMAISGLHIGLVAYAVYSIMRSVLKCWPCWRWLCGLPSVQGIAEVCAVLAALFYSVLAGLSLSTQRALLMLLALYGQTLAGRCISLLERFWWAAFLIVAVHPFALYSVSFWLSFGAVGCLIYAQYGGWRPSYIRWLWTQAVMTVGMAPLGLAFFRSVSSVSILANLVAIPWVSWLVVPAALLATGLGRLAEGHPVLHSLHTGAVYLLRMAALLFEPLWVGLRFLAAHAPMLSMSSPLPPWVMWTTFVGWAWLFAPRGVPGRVCALGWFMPLIAWLYSSPDIA